MRVVAGTEMTADQEIEALRAALCWALGGLYDAAVSVGAASELDQGEEGENYHGACRLAWPDAPENW